MHSRRVQQTKAFLLSGQEGCRKTQGRLVRRPGGYVSFANQSEKQRRRGRCYDRVDLFLAMSHHTPCGLCFAPKRREPIYGIVPGLRVSAASKGDG